MSTITGLVIMAGILVGGATIVIAIQEWSKVQMAKVRQNIIEVAKHDKV